MPLRDALFISIRGAAYGTAQHRELAGIGHELITSFHLSTSSRAIFLEDRQGTDQFVVSFVDKPLACLSNVNQAHVTINQFPQRLTASWHSTNRSVYVNQQRFASHGRVETIVSVKSWWAFFIRYLGSRSGSSK
jgi:hypothetical protein